MPQLSQEVKAAISVSSSLMCRFIKTKEEPLFYGKQRATVLFI